jgi:polysaccharide export outer membrane protein
MFRTISHALIFLASAAFAVAAQGQTPPKELVQYIRDAEKAGQSVFQIQQNAVDSGWPVATVTEAITFVRDEDAAAKQTGKASAAPDSSLTAPPETATPDHSAGAANPPAAAAPVEATPNAGGVPKPSEGPKPVDSPKPVDNVKPVEGAKPPAETIRTKPEKVNRGVPDDYEIGAGDVLEVNVWKEPEASAKGALVRTDGKISMPLLKEIYVIGLTPVQLEKQITDELSSRGLINTPDVTIIVNGTGSKKIYVTGKVKKEGPLPFNYRMNVMQALSEAGGLTDYAKRKKIYILRTDKSGATFNLPFNYDAAMKGQHLELNIQLQAGDNIIVP